jgi:hypothetical protein
MTKHDNINIKLEVCKDKTSGKLLIKAHFNSKAPNIFEQKDGTFWVPTVEEKDLLHEAFQLIPSDKYYNTSDNNTNTNRTNETEYMKDPTLEQKNESNNYQEYGEENLKDNDLQQYDKTSETDTYEIQDEQIKNEDYTENSDKKEETDTTNTDKTSTDEVDYNQKENDKILEDDGLIVEADSEAIEAALKKHSDKDKTIIEADEQTIIDKVLSQKKKGKWSKR